MKQDKPVVINLYGGPGAGKTTLALKLTAHLKEEYKGRVEYVPEYARELIFQTNEQDDFSIEFVDLGLPVLWSRNTNILSNNPF